MKGILVKNRNYIKLDISPLKSPHHIKAQTVKNLLLARYTVMVWCLFFQNEVHSLTYIFFP